MCVSGRSLTGTGFEGNRGRAEYFRCRSKLRLRISSSVLATQNSISYLIALGISPSFPGGHAARSIGHLQPPQCPHQWVPLTPLKIADVAALHSRFERELLLAHALQLPVAAHISAEELHH